VHALHLLFSIQLEPLLDVYSKVLALLFKAHLGPLIRIETLWARWVRIIGVSDLVATTFNLLAHLGTRDTLNGITDANSLVIIVIDLVVILTAVDLTTVKSLLSASFPHFLFRHLVKALLPKRRCLNDTR